MGEWVSMFFKLLFPVWETRLVNSSSVMICYVELQDFLGNASLPLNSSIIYFLVVQPRIHIYLQKQDAQNAFCCLPNVCCGNCKMGLWLLSVVKEAGCGSAYWLVASAPCSAGSAGTLQWHLSLHEFMGEVSRPPRTGWFVVASQGNKWLPNCYT